MYKLKLSENDIKVLSEMFGTSMAIINLKDGTIQLEEREEAENIIKRYGKKDADIAESPKISFDSIIGSHRILEDFLKQYGLENGILATAARMCVPSGRYDITMLVDRVRRKVYGEYSRKTRKLVKLEMEEELNLWCETYNIQMPEQTLNVFFKAIAKNFFS